MCVPIRPLSVSPTSAFSGLLQPLSLYLIRTCVSSVSFPSFFFMLSALQMLKLTQQLILLRLKTDDCPCLKFCSPSPCVGYVLRSTILTLVEYGQLDYHI